MYISNLLCLEINISLKFDCYTHIAQLLSTSLKFKFLSLGINHKLNQTFLISVRFQLTYYTNIKAIINFFTYRLEFLLWDFHQ